MAAPVAAANGKPRSGSKVLKVLLILAMLSVASVVLLVGALVIASGVGLFDADGDDGNASSQVDQPVTTAEAAEQQEGSNQQPNGAAPITPDGVSIAWDASPSQCDGNNNRSFSALVGNTTPEALELRIRILDSANTFVHQSHVYTVPSSDQVPVDLGGIPPGQWTVQMINEFDDGAIDQTNINFESC